jgi:hypothetical protein
MKLKNVGWSKAGVGENGAKESGGLRLCDLGSQVPGDAKWAVSKGSGERIDSQGKRAMENHLDQGVKTDPSD